MMTRSNVLAETRANRATGIEQNLATHRYVIVDQQKLRIFAKLLLWRAYGYP